MTSACRRRAVERSRATEGERGGASYKRIEYSYKKLFTIYQHIFPHLENVSKRKQIFIEYLFPSTTMLSGVVIMSQ